MGVTAGGFCCSSQSPNLLLHAPVEEILSDFIRINERLRRLESESEQPGQADDSRSRRVGVAVLELRKPFDRHSRKASQFVLLDATALSLCLQGGSQVLKIDNHGLNRSVKYPGIPP